ncbi:MAG: hypothetical protein H3C39_06580 [Flavobacteriia bacterium]|nr:hypothetical protein [Flavobacteriia bacterium]
MTDLLTEQIQKNKIYKDKAIWVGTFLGGPLVAGYYIAENFKAFNDSKKAKKTWFFAILSTIAIFGIVFLLPENIKIPNATIPIIYTVIAYSLTQHFQGKKITTHLDLGGEFFGWWRTIAVALIGAVITFVPLAGLILLIYGINYNSSEVTNTYGIMRNEITFDKNNISDTEVNKIANALTKTAYFDDEVTKHIYAEKVNEKYELSVSIGKDIAEDTQHLQLYSNLKNDLQTFFPNNKIVFKFVGDNLDDVIIKIE